MAESEEDNTIRVVLDGEEAEGGSSLCLIGKVLTNKNFNAFGLLETMKKAMNPSRGFTAKEIGKNLFSFQFRTKRDMEAIIDREPWHFDKRILMLKELGTNEQPSAVKFERIVFWVRMYDLPSRARKGKVIQQIAGICG